MTDQISIFSLLDQYETPEIPPEEQKKGVKGWIIEFSGIFLRENGFKEDWHGIQTRPVIFKEDTRRDKWGWRQNAETTKGPASGWCGGYYQVFRSRPTWADCLHYAREHSRKGDLQEVRYYQRSGDFEHTITCWEEGF